ncbi:porin [Mesorhizobium sp. J428]|uniref:porin n=1 Tax=Mesorhizobium sp. J428 TaxID=2898440 RepID=UPI002151F778|nr:porin [Mesorhizobium sp. J428]MCR5858980.1 porin [Mesorhizobium sp. J428]
MQSDRNHAICTIRSQPTVTFPQQSRRNWPEMRPNGDVPVELAKEVPHKFGKGRTAADRWRFREQFETESITMNIRGLLLGSAAALAAATSANAADAVMAPEPEPVEYVRVCDAYGSGFFYIPGTETCLQISGYVWYQIGATSEGAGDTPNYWAFARDGWNKSVRARVNFDARSETEWGTLRSYIRFQADWNGVGDGKVAADQAFIELGGLRMGYTESAWAETVNGISSFGSHTWGGLYYGYQQRALIQYNFSSNGFFGTISLEDDTLDGEGYVPDVVALIGYGADWGAVWARAAYDESFDGTPDGFGGVNDGGFAASIGTQINVPNMPGSSFRLIGYYADGDHQYGAGSSWTAYSTMGNSEWSVLASYYHQFTETFGASVGVQYFNDFYLAGTDISSGVDGWSADLGLVWVPVTNFEVRTELNYDDNDLEDGTLSGILRFTRFF